MSLADHKMQLLYTSNCVCMNLFIYVYGTIARKLKYKPTLFIEILKMKYLEINLMKYIYTYIDNVKWRQNCKKIWINIEMWYQCVYVSKKILHIVPALP